MSAPILAFTDYTKNFLLQTDASKEGLGVVLSRKQARWVISPNHAYGSQALMVHEKNYHSTKLKFLALEMGHHRKFQGLLAVPTLFSQN